MSEMIDMTALEYLKFICPDTDITKEDEAIWHLIQSHARQRTLLRERYKDWSESDEGKRWTCIVEGMTLHDCMDWFKAERIEKKTPY